MNAYSNVVALGDEGLKYLKSLEPKPINDEEDTGSMAQFMLDVNSRASLIEDDQKIQSNDIQSNIEQSGADFAAQFA